MIINILYAFFFALGNFVVYAHLNKTGVISNKFFWILSTIFLIVMLCHIGWLNFSFLLPWKFFFPAALLLAFPILVYFWFEFFVVRRIKRLSKLNEKTLNTVTNVLAFVFLRFVYVMVLILQCIIIFNH